jgi:hypothetical protein
MAEARVVWRCYTLTAKGWMDWGVVYPTRDLALLAIKSMRRSVPAGTFRARALTI